jgi:hypothetical protein
MSDKSAMVPGVRVRFARSATKHRISKGSIRYVIAHCGLCFEEPPPANDAEVLDRRLVCLGDNISGQAIEVIAVEGDGDDQYEEVKQWRR